MRNLLLFSYSLIYVAQETSGWGLFAKNKFDSLRVEEKTSKYERWFTQSLDHFNPRDERTWQQRYYVNEEYFNNSSKSIAFLQIGGEGEATENWVVNGSMIEYAKEVNAICFLLEHRYYGKSHPTKDLSTENLQFLTSQQALADLAFFVRAMNKEFKLSSDTKWIAFGGSYPGNLAAWLRQKYPHLITGAMSASGPLLAQLNFPEYLEVVKADLRRNSEGCWKAVREGFKQVEATLYNSYDHAKFDALFKVCDPVLENVKHPLDMSNLFENIADSLSGAAQYDKDNRKFNVEHNVTVDALCDIMTNDSKGSELARLAAVSNWLLSAYNESCLDYKYDKSIRNIRNVSWDSKAAGGGRQWTYQTCTEFGYYQTSTKVFGNQFPLEFYVKQCADIFGPKYNKTFLEKAVERTNTFYGGLDIDVSNVVFVHGTSDPWKVLGITKTRNNAAPAILIEGAAHCATMYPSSEKDSPQLRAARTEINRLIGSWLDI